MHAEIPHEQPNPPQWLMGGTEVTYRSAMLGIWGIAVRYAQMPLERLALVANSAQVAGHGQLFKACSLVFKDGWLSPWKVVTARSGLAWFLQYSMIGAAFQVSDRFLSRVMGVEPFAYGDELFKDYEEEEISYEENEANARVEPLHLAKLSTKVLLAPTLAAVVESFVSNKAEVERFYGKKEFARVEKLMVSRGRGVLQGVAGQAFWANAARNGTMSFATFIGTPFLFSTVVREEHKNPSTLACFGMFANLGANVVGTVFQSSWGRSLDFLSSQGHLNYGQMVRKGLESEGISAFVNPTKWATRVGMNIIPQGLIPWYYNTIVPLGEGAAKKTAFYAWSKWCYVLSRSSRV